MSRPYRILHLTPHRFDSRDYVSPHGVTDSPSCQLPPLFQIQIFSSETRSQTPTHSFTVLISDITSHKYTKQETKNKSFEVLLTVHLSIFISLFNQTDAQNLFYNKFYFMPLHVSSTRAHHQEVKIALHSLWYHHTYRCDDFVHQVS